jgi:hypothetical protein
VRNNDGEGFAPKVLIGKLRSWMSRTRNPISLNKAREADDDLKDFLLALRRIGLTFSFLIIFDFAKRVLVWYLKTPILGLPATLGDTHGREVEFILYVAEQLIPASIIVMLIVHVLGETISFVLRHLRLR